MNVGIRADFISEKNRRALGPAIWLYLWCRWRQTDNSGRVLYGRSISYRQIRSETGYPLRSLQRWMAKLQVKGYIELREARDCFDGFHLRVTAGKKFFPRQREFAFNVFQLPSTTIHKNFHRPPAKSGGHPPPKVAGKDI